MGERINTRWAAGLSLVLMAAVLAVLAVPPPARAAYTAKTFEPDWGKAAGLDFADFNGDGEYDIALTDANTEAAVLTAQSAGSYTQTFSHGSLNIPLEVAHADVDGNGDPDLLVADSVGIRLFLGSGDGTFGPPTTLSAQAPDFAVADINHDGDPDIAETLPDGKVGILLGQSGAAFAPRAEIAVGAPGSATDGIVAGDFNEDGDPDFALVINGTAGKLLLGDPNDDGFSQGTFDLGPRAVPLVADFDGDGHLDVAGANFDMSASTQTISFARGAGDGTFAAPVTIGELESAATTVTAGDFDGDGNGDLAVGNPAFMRIFRGESVGGAATWPSTDVAVPGTPRASTSEDLDGDGKDELLISDSGGLTLIRDDTQPPDTAIDGGPAGSTADDRPTFTFHSTEDDSTFECSLDEADPVSCNDGSFRPATSLSEGSHTFDVVATDPAGNADPSPAERSFNLDQTAPTLEVTRAPDPGAVTNAPRYEFSFSDDVTASPSAICSIDGGAGVACDGGSYDPPLTLPDGEHTFRVVVEDEATNRTSYSATFRYDGTAPETTIASGPSGPTSLPRFSFGSDDPDAQFACRVDGAPFAPCPADGYSPAGLADGAHRLDVRAQDRAGNFDATPASQTFAVDTTAPAIVLRGLKRRTTDRTPTIRISVREPVTGLACAVDGKEAKPCGVRYTLKRLKPGRHRLVVTAEDVAGNERSVAAAFKVKRKRKR
jgi:hypothetical protein